MTGVQTCALPIYQRRPAPDAWPYTLYAMIHGRSRAEAIGTLARAEEAAGIAGVPREVLFSLHCYRQRGALVAGAASPREAAS